jgi:hypothetical protein
MMVSAKIRLLRWPLPREFSAVPTTLFEFFWHTALERPKPKPAPLFDFEKLTMLQIADPGAQYGIRTP